MYPKKYIIYKSVIFTLLQFGAVMSIPIIKQEEI